MLADILSVLAMTIHTTVPAENGKNEKEEKTNTMVTEENEKEREKKEETSKKEEKEKEKEKETDANMDEKKKQVLFFFSTIIFLFRN